MWEGKGLFFKNDVKGGSSYSVATFYGDIVDVNTPILCLVLALVSLLSCLQTPSLLNM